MRRRLTIKLSDPAQERARWQPGRDGRVRCSALVRPRRSHTQKSLPNWWHKMVASKSESSCPHLSASSAARTLQSLLHRKPDPRNLSLFKAVCKIPMMRSGLTTQAQRPGDWDAGQPEPCGKTESAPPGSLQRLVGQPPLPKRPNHPSMNRPWRQIRQRLQIVCDQNTHRCSAARESSATDAQPANKNASPSARRGDAQRPG